MQESDVPEWISDEVEVPPSETVVLEGSPNVTSQAQQQIFVQGGGPGMMMVPATNAVLALVLGILGLVMCSVCTAVPGLILAQGALAITSQYPGHPDQGMAKAAQIISWIGIGLFILLMLFYGGIFAAVLVSGA